MQTIRIIVIAVILVGCKPIVENLPTEPTPSPTPAWGPPEAPPPGAGVLQVGATHAIIFWPDFPRVVYGGSENLVLRRRQTFRLDRAHRISSIKTFIGFDRGDIGEAHVMVSDRNGVPLYDRSMHRQNGYDENYDAYNTQAVPVYTVTDTVTVDLLVRCTGENTNKYAAPRNNPLSVFFDANVTFYFGD